MQSMILSAALFSSVAVAQSLIDATNSYPQLSQFRNLLASFPQLLPQANSSSKITVLIPNDDAFTTYATNYGANFSNLDLTTLSNNFQYHTINGGLSTNLATTQLANTELTAPKYDLRNGTAGQVVVINPAEDANSTSAIVKSGAGHQVNMNVINGNWDGGNFQIVDGFLTLPATCTDTMADKANGWTTLISALARTNLTNVLNTFPNVTCLAPNNAAFANAGNPDTSLPIDKLASALEYHTLVGAQYSTGFTNGSIFNTANGGKVQVTVLANGSTFFNDAMVLDLNVITNNGVIHVLDRVMSALNTTQTSSSSSTSASGTATVTSSGAGSGSTSKATSTSSPTSSASPKSSPNAAEKLLGASYFPAAIALAALAI